MPSTRHRRSMRFGLRTLLASIVIIAIPLAWIAKERRQSRYEEDLARQLREIGFKDITFGAPYATWEVMSHQEQRGWWGELARSLLGERVLLIESAPAGFRDLSKFIGFKSVCSLALAGSQVDDLQPLIGIRSLKGLSLRGSPLCDISALARVTRLNTLDLEETQVQEVTSLAGLQNLEYLNIYGAPINDLNPLLGLTKLKELTIKKSQVSDEQLKALQEALPNCKINHQRFADFFPDRSTDSATTPTPIRKSSP